MDADLIRSVAELVAIVAIAVGFGRLKFIANKSFADILLLQHEINNLKIRMASGDQIMLSHGHILEKIEIRTDKILFLLTHKDSV